MGHKRARRIQEIRRIINFHRLTRRVGYKGKDRGEDHLQFNTARNGRAFCQVGKMYKKGLDVSPEDRGRMLFELLGVKFDRSEAESVYERSWKDPVRLWILYEIPEAESPK